MQTVYTARLKTSQYALDASAHIATHFDSLEKTVKIGSRLVDIISLLVKGAANALKPLSLQLKDMILIIESTRLIPVSFPLLFCDENGKRFFQVKTRIQIIERVSLTFHLVLKTLSGLDRVRLIELGKIAVYSLGHLTLLRWLLESSILSYNFFGAVDGVVAFRKALKSREVCKLKIEKWKIREKIPGQEAHACKKIHQWEDIQKSFKKDEARALLKIAATVLKSSAIALAVTLAAINYVSVMGDVAVLSLASISDSFGLARIFHFEYSV